MFTRVPLNFQKSFSQTDWASEDIAHPATTAPGSTYNHPLDREDGNTVFRRHPDGSLDYEAAKDTVVECIHKEKNKVVPLTDLEQLILSVYFPTVFSFLDYAVADKMRSIQLKVTPDEINKVCQLVAQHISAEMSYMHTTKY